MVENWGLRFRYSFISVKEPRPGDISVLQAYGQQSDHFSLGCII